MPTPSSSPSRGSHIFDQSTGIVLLGLEIKADVYLSNGFRFIPSPANIGRAEVHSLVSGFRNRCKLDPTYEARERAIRLGYGGGRRFDPAEATSALTDPRRRFVAELFWPHLDAGAIAAMRAAGSIAELDPASEPLSAWRESAGGCGPDAARAGHAIAVCLHNRAIARELAILAEPESALHPVPTNDWREALSAWARVLRNDDFWGYLAVRIRESGHITLRPPEVFEEVRSRLPLALLGFHNLFARLHAARGRAALAEAHIELVRSSGFAAPAVSEMSRTISTNVAKSLLAEQTLSISALAGSRVPRDRWDKAAEPILTETETLMNELARSVGEVGAVGSTGWADEFCQAGLQAINSGIDYRAGENVRNIHHGIVMLRRLSQLPISAGLRYRLENQVRSDTASLYPVAAPAGFDPSDCWFAPGNPADADASVVITLCRVTRETPFNLQWSNARVLIPRSRMAEAFHRSGRWDPPPELPAGSSNMPTQPPRPKPTVSSGRLICFLVLAAASLGIGLLFLAIPGVRHWLRHDAPMPRANSRPRPLAAQKAFPVLKTAIAAGYQVGEKPAQKDMSAELRQFIAGLSRTERLLLSSLSGESRTAFLRKCWDEKHPF